MKRSCYDDRNIILNSVDNCRFGISGSLDCYIAFWNLDTGIPLHVHVTLFYTDHFPALFSGQLVHKIYTFSSIQCFVYHEKHVYTGSGLGIN